MSDPVNLIGPDGREYVFDSSQPGADLQAALKAGYRQAGEEGPTLGESAMGVVSDVADVAGAAGLGLTQGLSGGLYGAGLAAVDKTAGQEMARQREESPIAYGVGELGGIIASPLTRAAEAVTAGVGATTVAGRIGAEALGQGIGGALFGAGNAVSDAALLDVPLTAEKLLAGAGLGAVLGAAGGGLGAAIGEGAAALLPKAGKLIGGAQKALDDVADDAVISSTRAEQRELNKIGEERLSAAAKAMRDRGHLAGGPDEILAKVSADRQGVGAQLGKHIDDVDAAGARAAVGGFAKRLDDFEASLNPLERKSIARDLRDARSALGEMEAKGATTFRAIDDLKQTIQAKAKFSKGPVPLDDVQFGLKRQLAGIFRDELDQQLLPALGADAGKAFTESKALYGALKDAERLATSGAGRTKGFGLKDYLVGLAGSGIGAGIGGPEGGLEGAAFGLAMGLGRHQLARHGPALIAKLADGLAKSPTLATIAEGFSKQLATAAPRLGPYGAALMEEAQQGAPRALAAHLAYAQLDPSYAATAQLAGLTPEAPDEHVAALKRTTGLTAIQEVAKAQDEDIRKRVEKALKGGGASVSPGVMKSQDFGAKRMRRGADEAHSQRVDEVRQLAANPELLIERVTANMGDVASVAPSVAAAMTATAQRAVEYLAKQAEVPPKAGPLAQEWDMPQSDRWAFAMKLETVQEPLSVLKYAAAGTLTEEQMEALRAVYPGVAQQIADTALEQLAEGPKGVPYSARLMVSLLAGIDPDGTLSGEAIAANQAAIQAAGDTQRSDGAPGAPGSPNGDAGNVSVAQRTATRQQRRELQQE